MADLKLNMSERQSVECCMEGEEVEKLCIALRTSASSGLVWAVPVRTKECFISVVDGSILVGQLQVSLIEE